MTSAPTLNVLTHVLEDDQEVINMLQKLFELNGFVDSRFFRRADEFVEAMNENVHIAVIDYYLDGPLNGLEVLKIIMSQNPMCKAIMISGQRNSRVIVEFFHNGGFRYVNKGDSNYSNELVTYMQDAIEKVKGQIEIYHELRELNGKG